MRRLLGAIVIALTGTLAMATPAFACETYTFDDSGFGLERGIAWAFAGTVVGDEPNADLSDRPNAVVIRVDRTVAGSAGGTRLRIEQDAGCDGFWYRRGDQVIVAVPIHPGLGPPSATLRPPFTGLTNYQVAVWVLDGDRIDPGLGPHSRPLIDGRAPATARDLVTMLARLPDTATATAPAVEPARSPETMARTMVLVLATALGAGLALRRRRPRSGSRTTGQRRVPFADPDDCPPARGTTVQKAVRIPMSQYGCSGPIELTQ